MIYAAFSILHIWDNLKVKFSGTRA